MLTKDPAKVGRLNEHLWRKIEDHTDEIVMVKADLQEDARTLLVSYGITARAMTEAANTARNQGQDVSTVAIQSLWPVPEDALTGALCGPSCQGTIERVIVAELNLGDFRREVERVIYRWAAHSRRIAPEILGINRVDGELITPGQFLELILS
jgi:2-oxoglutarate ferredoxin oxidoreductase subunit alpha